MRPDVDHVIVQKTSAVGPSTSALSISEPALADTIVFRRPCGCVDKAIATGVDINSCARVERECARARGKGLDVEHVASTWVREQSRWQCHVCRGRNTLHQRPQRAALTEAM